MILLKDEIRNKISSYLKNKISRIELVEWIQTINISRDNNYIDPIVEAAFNAIRSATVKDNSFNEHGEPYFIRDYDLNEWLMSLENRDFIRSTNSEYIQLRPHQVTSLGIDQLIAFNVDPINITTRIGIEHIRGLDELDFFQEFNFQFSTEVQFRLIRHMRSQEPNAFIFYSNKNYPIKEIIQILNKLDLSIPNALWINPEIQDKLAR
jgi:arsenate reductase-like glutaredoxin family protein